MQTAGLLRETRNGNGEAIEWAHLSLPEHRLAHRMHVLHLQRMGDHHAADSMILHGLRKWPNDSRMRLMRAARLIERHRLADAAVEIERVLQRRPGCAEALHWQAKIEWRLSHFATAAALLERVIWHGAPLRRRAALIDLVKLLVEADSPTEAERAMQRLSNPPLELVAAVHEAQGRWTEMDEALAVAATTTTNEKKADELTARRIALLDRLGDVPRLRELTVAAKSPRAVLAAGQAMLRLGEFAQAIRAGFALRNNHDLQDEALTLLTVAGGLAGRRDLARRSLLRLRRCTGGVEPGAMARCWQRGLMGRIIHGQRFNARPGCDPGTSLLRPLLAQAGKSIGKLDSRRAEAHLPAA